MRPRSLVDRVAAAFAGQQRGLVARWQLLAAGITEHLIDDRVRSGRWLVVYPGVYAVGHRALQPEASWLAAVLAYGPRALAADISAAGVRGLLRDFGPKPHVVV